MTPPSVETLQPPTHIIERAVYESTCSPCRSKRGAVVYAGADFIAAAHNWKPQPFTCDGSATCKATCRVEAVHAEQAALLSADWRVLGAEMLHVKTVDGALVPSGGPSCVQCSKLILAAGIEAMWLYQNDGWHRYEAAEFHRLSLAATLAQQQARIAELEQQLAECYRLTGADPDGNEDWRLAADAVAEVRALRDRCAAARVCALCDVSRGC